MACHDEIQQSPDEDLGHVMSLSWDKGKLGAAYYNLSTLELFVSNETLDFSPEFIFAMNLLRQVKPLYILASGLNFFLKELLGYFNLPKDADLAEYRVKNFRMTSLLPLVVHAQNEKNLNVNRQRVLGVRLPGMSEESEASDRAKYIENLLPMHQHLVVHSLGALLEYLNVNRQHLFLGQGSDLIINDLKVYSLQSEVPIDDFTMSSLQIFSEADHHPSGYKKGENQAIKEGFSVFRLVDRCFSRLGSKTMKMILSHPIRNSEELNMRYDTIEWYLSYPSSEKLQLIKKYLKHIGDISQVFRNIVLQPEKIKSWHLFKKIVYNAYMVMKCCKEIGSNASPNTLFAELADAIEDDDYVLQVLHVLDRVVDLDKGLSHSKFSVQMGLDADLDEKKLLMISLQDSIQEAVQGELKDLSSTLGDVCCYYIPEVGYVIKLDCVADDPLIEGKLNENFTLVSRSNDASYFQNTFCNELNKKYGSLYSEIREHESRICQRLISFLKERLVGIQQVVKLCAQLDCTLSFAQVAEQMSLQKPELIPEKSMFIKQGRHILWELRQPMVPNDFSSTSKNEKLLTLLSAPNSSGKSVYLKQVALTAYLVHVGAYVPTSRTQMGILDSIYSRINCPESLYGNNSSFLCDVRQLGKVMSNSTDRSLILIDEFGKGTTLLEAKALLASCIEDLLERGDKCPITIISTHYADVYDIIHEKCRTSIVMKTFENVSNNGGELLSTFKLKGGRSVRNYATKIASVKEFMDEIDKRSANEVKDEFYAKVQLAVFMIWMRLHGKRVDFKKIIENAIV